MFESIFSGKFASRYRAAETADINALQQALIILNRASDAIIRENALTLGCQPSRCPKWSKVYHARQCIECQLNDVISLAMGEKLK